jgi:hypothetical protein
MAVKTGINRRQPVNLFDPDGTRNEPMEAKTVDGVPAVSSTAAPIANLLKFVFLWRMLFTRLAEGTSEGT